MIFSGIIHDFADHLLTLNIGTKFNSPYITYGTIDNNIVEIHVEKDKIIIEKDAYDYNYKYYPDEIILSGIEKKSFFYKFFPCLQNRKFFVVSHKNNN